MRNPSLPRESCRYFRSQPLSREDYLASRFIAEPLCLFDCDIPIEGAAAFLITSAERAGELRQPPAYIAACAQQTSSRRTLISYVLDDYVECGGTLANQLWKDAGLGPREMRAAQLYDGFSPSVYYWLEAAGFCGRGEAHSFIQGGRIDRDDGELPLNTFGGSLSEGRLHGMGHLAEAARQVAGRAGPRQVADCDAACAIDGSPLLRGSGIVFTAEP